MKAEIEIVTRKQARELGLKRYFTGKICPLGHSDERQVVNGTCLECLRIKSRIRRPDYQKKNRKRITDMERERCRIKAINDPEWVRHRKEYMLAWRANPENKKREKESATLYKKNHRSEYVSFENNRRTRKTSNGGTFTAKDINTINKMQKYTCAGYDCGKPTKEKYHIDHIVPVSKGGSNWPKNLQILCQTYNVKKNSKDPIVWAQENGRLV